MWGGYVFGNILTKPLLVGDIISKGKVEPIEENFVLEIGTVRSVSLISNIYLVTVNFQYNLELVGRIQCLSFQELISKAIISITGF